MKKYRIKQVIDVDDNHKYFLEKKFLFFWINTLYGGWGPNYYSTYEDAKKEMIRLMKKPRIDYFYPNENM